MSYFTSPAEVDCFVGGALRLAAVHPVVGPQLAAASMTLALICDDPTGRLTVVMGDPVRVGWNDGALADVELTGPADVLDRYFRGECSLVGALADGTIRARGRVSRVLKILPALEPIFPLYRGLVAGKDACAIPQWVC
ncbi:MAG: hypothetical protein JWN84_3542 [Nocardioides sp.]|jgi:hypothetical protein|nr:hypothetical protein [Nocardioides sp.]